VQPTTTFEWSGIYEPGMTFLQGWLVYEPEYTAPYLKECDFFYFDSKGWHSKTYYQGKLIEQRDI
jgi:hypothetical protein